MATPEGIVLDVGAGGYGTRAREFIGDALPKHLLPTGNLDNEGQPETLLGRIVTQSTAENLHPVIHANHANAPHFRAALGAGADIRVSDLQESYPLAHIRRLVVEGGRTVGAVGDHFTPDDFSWLAFLERHQQSAFPVSVATTTSSKPRSNASVYDIGPDGEIRGARRLGRETTPDDLFNLGIYVYDPHPDVLSVLESLGITPDSIAKPIAIEPGKIATELIKRGMLGALQVKDSFNINDEGAYLELLARNGIHVVSAREYLGSLGIGQIKTIQ